ncbi:MAG: tripartite tricarboxylate transporter substrate binding protein [Nitratireductor sp.]
MFVKKLIISLGILLAGLVSVHAQDYPTKPITIVIPYSTGGGADALARLFASEMEQTLGQPVVIEARPGAATMLAIDYVANAPADGYTVLLAFSSITVNPVVFPNADYELMKDFVPIAQLTTVPHMLAASKASGVSSLAEFIELAKSKPGALNYASVGEGSSLQLEAELLKKLTGTDITHIPYQGGAAILVDLLAGRVDMTFLTLSSLAGPTGAGEAVALAVTGDKRSSVVPDVPTFAEAGVEGFNAIEWAGFFVPDGTPDGAVNKLADSVAAALGKADFQERMSKIGFQPSTMNRQEFLSTLENDPWSQIAKELGIRIEQ